MKKIIAFVILVILVIVMIVLSYNFYSNNNKTSKKNKLNSGLTVTTTKTKDKDSDSDKKKEESTDNTTDSNTTNTDNVDNTANSGEANVPDTASDNDSDYINIDYYTVGVDKSTLKVGDSSKIYVKVYPRNASEREVSYISSDESVVKVNSFGKMKALSKGEVNITVKVRNANDYNFKVIVK